MYALFALIGFSSTLLSSVFGFGSALLVLSIGPYLLPVHEVIALSAILFAASTITKTIVFRQSLDWSLVLIIAIGSLPFAYLGGMLLPLLSQPLLQIALGLLILASLAMKHPSIARSLRSSVGDPADVSRYKLTTIAASYGLVSGLVGSGSVIKALFFRRMQLAKETFVGTMAATSVLASIGKIAAYTQSGLLHSQLLWPALAMLVAALAAVLIGRAVLLRIESRWFDTGVTVLMAVAACGLLLRGFSHW